MQHCDVPTVSFASVRHTSAKAHARTMTKAIAAPAVRQPWSVLRLNLCTRRLPGDAASNAGPRHAPTSPPAGLWHQNPGPQSGPLAAVGCGPWTLSSAPSSLVP